MYNFSTWVTETDPEKLLQTYEPMLRAAGFGILSITEQHFQPHGYTMLALLSESHFAIHTFPEHEQTYIELSSCIKKQYDAFLSMYSQQAQTA